MYHELLLHASVPAYRHTQVLSILAGITAQAPTSIQQRQYIFSPKRMPTPKLATKGGSQEIGNKRQVKEVGDVYMLRLVHELQEDDEDEEDDEYEDKDVKMADTSTQGAEKDSGSPIEARADGQAQSNTDEMAQIRSRHIRHKGTWQLRFYDTPEPGKKSVTSRLAQVTDIVDGDAISFVNGMGYSCTTRYVTLGHTFVHNNIILHLYRVLPLPLSHTAGEPWKPTVSGEDLKPLDVNDGYLLEAKVKLLDGGQPDLVAQGTQELTQFREAMKGTLDLRVADRLSLDTKVTVR